MHLAVEGQLPIIQMGEADSSGYLRTIKMAISFHFRGGHFLLIFYAARISQFIYYINFSLADSPPSPS